MFCMKMCTLTLCKSHVQVRIYTLNDLVYSQNAAKAVLYNICYFIYHCHTN